MIRRADCTERWEFPNSLGWKNDSFCLLTCPFFFMSLAGILERNFHLRCMDLELGREGAAFLGRKPAEPVILRRHAAHEPGNVPAGYWRQYIALLLGFVYITGSRKNMLGWQVTPQCGFQSGSSIAYLNRANDLHPAGQAWSWFSSTCESRLLARRESGECHGSLRKHEGPWL